MELKLKYALQSKVNGKYLSNIFAKSHSEMFSEEKPAKGKTHFFDIREIADSIAKALNARSLNFIPESVGFDSELPFELTEENKSKIFAYIDREYRNSISYGEMRESIENFLGVKLTDKQMSIIQWQYFEDKQ